jgi:hypothetical protein
MKFESTFREPFTGKNFIAKNKGLHCLVMKFFPTIGSLTSVGIKAGQFGPI